MPKGITIQEADRRYVKGSLMAFLDGEKNLNWFRGVATKGANKEHFIQAVEELRSRKYGSAERWSELDSLLQEMA